jgi:hypothetical protein
VAIDQALRASSGNESEAKRKGAMLHSRSRSVKLIPGAKLIVYPGAPHGITDTHKDRLNADLLAFLKS